MKIIALNEGTYAVSKQKEFNLLTDENRDEKNSGYLTMAVCPFLIVTGDDVILLDAGLGFTNNGQPLLAGLLDQHGYTTGDITKVLMSHLHKDHIDGIGQLTENGIISNFPNATIYIQQRELDYALSETESYSFNQKTLREIMSLSNLYLMNEDKGNIGDHITFEVTGGHSPYHQAFWITENDEIAFYGADNLPQRSYLKFHIAYKSDHDGKKAMELRQLWEKQAKDEHWSVLFYHDVKNNVVKF